MILKAIFNDTTEFQLVDWDYSTFRDDLTLTVQGMDIVALRNACLSIEKIEIYRDDFLVGTFTSFDTFSNITYLGAVFIESEKKYSDAMRVQLTKANIIDQVQRLDEQINPTIDTNKMTVDEYKTYKLALISDECRNTIYSGDDVTLSNGTVEHFSFTAEDQTDLIALANLAMAAPELTLPWHHDSGDCRMYSGVDIIIIYGTLYSKLLLQTTICNALNQLIRAATTKEEIDQYGFDKPLPPEYHQRVSDIISDTSQVIQAIMGKYLPPNNNDNNDNNNE